MVVIDYERHEDEALRAQQADLWLGFEPAELRRFAREAGLTDVRVSKIPTAWCGAGADRHVPWQVMTARAAESANATHDERNPQRAPTKRASHGAKK